MLLGWNRLDTNPGRGNGAKGHRVTWLSDNKDGLIFFSSSASFHISSSVWIGIHRGVKCEGLVWLCMHDPIGSMHVSLFQAGLIFDCGSLSLQCRAHPYTSMAADLLHACLLVPTWLLITCWQAHVIPSRCVVSEIYTFKGLVFWK